jgi:hypothetical protein
LHAASVEFGVSRETLSRRLHESGYDPKKVDEWTIRQVHEALSGDLAAAKLRRENAEADKAEVEAEIAKKTVIPREDVAQFIRETFAPVREMIMTLPGSQSALVNPSDPEHARGHLQSWSDQFLKHCKMRVPMEPIKEEKEV